MNFQKIPFLFLLLFCLVIHICCEEYSNDPYDSPTEDSWNPRAAAPAMYQAEDHSFQKGCTKQSNYAGYTGAGFMDYGGKGSLVEWNNVNVSSAGQYTLTFRYANGGASDRGCTVTVNGSNNAGNLSFASTGRWTEWSSISIQANLKAGNNKIRVMAHTSSGGPNLDKMEVKSDGGDESSEGSGDSGGDCVDQLTSCASLAGRGYCTGSFSAYMQRNCCASCNGAGGDDGDDGSDTGQCNDQAGIDNSAQDSYGPGAVRAVHRPITCGRGSTVEQDSGPAQNRINLILIGDGYTQTELQNTWPKHVDNALDIMFGPNTEPYGTYQRYLNVCRLNVASRESGVDQATGKWPPSNYDYIDYKDTALDGVCNVENRLGTIDEQKFRRVMDGILAGTGIDADWVGAILNTEKWCNSGGQSAVWAGYTKNLDVAYHESGHSWHGLADEYYGDCVHEAIEPKAANVTIKNGGKWPEWADYDQANIGEIGWYEGGHYCSKGVYRPSSNSKMNWVSFPHNAVSIQKMVHDFYELVRPIDAWTDNRKTLVNPCRIQIKLIDPSLVNVTWSIDGKRMTPSDVEALTISGRNLSRGIHEVKVIVQDATSYVRNERSDLQQTLKWNINITSKI